VKKLAKFDRSGRFIEERRLRRYPEFCIDENRFITGDQIGGRPEWIQKISVVEFPPDSEEVIEHELFRAENTGIVWGEGNQAFAEIWGTPRMVYVCDRELERVYVGFNIGLAEFYDFGLATITELPDGMQVYEEYRVLNLPELFGADGH